MNDSGIHTTSDEIGVGVGVFSGVGVGVFSGVGVCVGVGVGSSSIVCVAPLATAHSSDFEVSLFIGFPLTRK